MTRSVTLPQRKAIALALPVPDRHLYVRRLKKGAPSNQPIYGDEVRALRQLMREYPDSPWVFTSERKAPLTTRTVRDIVDRAAYEARLGLKVHPHMIRHSTGFYLAAKGYDTRKIQDYLGHRQIQHTVRYTRLAPGQFEGMWDTPQDTALDPQSKS